MQRFLSLGVLGHQRLWLSIITTFLIEGRASEKSGIGNNVIPGPRFRGYFCSLSRCISGATVLPYPVEVGHDQSSNALGRLPDLRKLILTSMPTTGLLPDDAIGSF